jgi:hypothetical protein
MCLDRLTLFTDASNIHQHAIRRHVSTCEVYPSYLRQDVRLTRINSSYDLDIHTFAVHHGLCPCERIFVQACACSGFQGYRHRVTREALY